MIQSNMTFIFNFGNYLFSGWSPTDDQWERSGLNKPEIIQSEISIEIEASPE